MDNPGTNISALDVAKYFLQKANNDGDLITNLKIQKLLFYAQAWHLVNFNVPLFKEEIEAWNLGPVIREVYDAFRVYGATPIKYEETGRETEVFTDEQKNYLDEFYDIFSKFSAHELVNMSHSEPPWKEGVKAWHKVISPESMKKYYSSLIESGKKE